MTQVALEDLDKGTESIEVGLSVPVPAEYDLVVGVVHEERIRKIHGVLVRYQTVSLNVGDTCTAESAGSLTVVGIDREQSEVTLRYNTTRPYEPLAKFCPSGVLTLTSLEQVRAMIADHEQAQAKANQWSEFMTRASERRARQEKPLAQRFEGPNGLQVHAGDQLEVPVGLQRTWAIVATETYTFEPGDPCQLEPHAELVVLGFSDDGEAMAAHYRSRSYAQWNALGSACADGGTIVLSGHRGIVELPSLPGKDSPIPVATLSDLDS